jgi:hypothetical protein
MTSVAFVIVVWLDAWFCRGCAVMYAESAAARSSPVMKNIVVFLQGLG